MPKVKFEEPSFEAKSLSVDERKKHVMLINTDNAFNKSYWQTDVNVIFSTVLFKRKKNWFRRADYIIGCVGGTVQMILSGDAKLLDYTKDRLIETVNTEAVTSTTGSKSSFKPAFEIESEGVKAKVSGGERTRAKSKEIVQERKYKTEESAVQHTVMGDNMIKWDFMLPSSKAIGNNWLSGNSHLMIKVRLGENPVGGQFEVMPGLITLFDENKIPIPNKRFILMRFALWLRGNKVILHPDGHTLKFVIA